MAPYTRVLGPALALLLFTAATVLMLWAAPDHTLPSPIGAVAILSKQRASDSAGAAMLQAVRPPPLTTQAAIPAGQAPVVKRSTAGAAASDHREPSRPDSTGTVILRGAVTHAEAPAALSTTQTAEYPDVWSELRRLFQLGEKNPDYLIQALKNGDPLNVSLGPDGFSCPTEPITILSDSTAADADRLARFVATEPGTWIFYQHLRKAGGTGFCQLATDNLKKGEVPPYYCMVDRRGSLATPPWNDPSYTTEKLRNGKFRITANEWDVFYESMFNWPGAIFATTMREPIDRIYSQYRFEHLEHRDGSVKEAKRKTAKEYYLSQRGWTMGSNYYIKTFIGDQDKVPAKAGTGDFYWTYSKYRQKKLTWEMFDSALRNIMRFHLIFITEWLEPSSTAILNRTLHWTVPPKQVLPHEVQALRKIKRSSSAEDCMSRDDYMYILRDNIFDLLFFRAVQRIYLERLNCQ